MKKAMRIHEAAVRRWKDIDPESYRITDSGHDEMNAVSVRCQNARRNPNWKVRGSVALVTWPKFDAPTWVATPK